MQYGAYWAAGWRGIPAKTEHSIQPLSMGLNKPRTLRQDVALDKIAIMVAIIIGAGYHFLPYARRGSGVSDKGLRNFKANFAYLRIKYVQIEPDKFNNGNPQKAANDQH